MKRLKTRNEYVGCNGKARYYADKRMATSYNHWVFVAVINGKTIFNNYRYSNTTSKHQSEVEYLMDSLGHEIDLYVNMEDSLNSDTFKKEALYSLYGEAIRLIVQCNTPRVRKNTIENNKVRLDELREEIKRLRELGAEFSFKRIVRFYRLYVKDVRAKEFALQFLKENKGQVFRDLISKNRYILKGKKLSTNRFILKSLNTNRELYCSWYSFYNNFKKCPLSNALNGNIGE